MQGASRGQQELFDASTWRLGIVVAQFNADITGRLLASALERATDYQVPREQIEVVKVAGAAELPLVLQHLARTQKYDALLAVGCVIRGATPHFEYVCQLATAGILRVQLDEHIAIGYGVLTCNDKAEAEARAHLGGEHLDAALAQAKLLRD